MTSICVLTDEVFDQIDDAIGSAMMAHESVNLDSKCSCGVSNNMDGDVLTSHRVSMVCAAVRSVLE